MAANVCGYTPVNLGKQIKEGVLSDICSIHRMTIDRATEKKEIQASRLFQKEKGIYTDERQCSDIAVVVDKYPKAIFTGESAYYYYGLTDTIPECFHLATLRTDSRIKDPSVRQYFVNEAFFDVGKTTITYHGIQLPIYSKERLLVELIRQKSNLSFDYYKEIISNYRRLSEELDFFAVEECAAKFSRYNSIMKAIELEVL